MHAILWVLSDTPGNMMVLSINVDRNNRLFAGYYNLADFYSVRWLLEAMNVKGVSPEDTLYRKWTEQELILCEQVFKESSVEFV